ncbi:hypothetical protein HK097_007278 [Rhizophlyctis rosea]|uniref:Uncharacterized protein n=1 Tax=Rhizophlyctis rosea TaxID=64517 RepID=A0AAD5SBU1_9FUNG|nr:hypothetical protein HK097_007278 [Rhizophlyctis rosea]
MSNIDEREKSFATQFKEVRICMASRAEGQWEDWLEDRRREKGPMHYKEFLKGDETGPNGPTLSVILGQEDAPTKQMTPSSANTGQFTNTAYTNVDHAGLRTTNTPHQPDQGSAKGDSNEEKVTSTGTGGPGSLLGDRLGV